MTTKITLGDYVKKRNGVALGHRQSLPRMLKRSFGAGSFRMFWQHWNPIWSYYLSRYVMRPMDRLLPTSLACILTFFVSGVIHDSAIAIVKQEPYFFFSPWFTVMGVYVLLETKLKLSYRKAAWLIKATLNLTTIIICFFVANSFTHVYW